MEFVEKFKNNGYCIINKSVLSTEIIDFVTQYTLFDEMQDFTPDNVQVPDAHSKYADPAMETVLILLHPFIEKFTGLDLDPTYSFYRVYRPGDALKVHTDRESCEISATMCFNFNYENLDYRWPIYIEGTEAKLNPGEMIIYKGCQLNHWRDKFIGSENDWHVQGFFHYVDKNGPFANFKFDKRNTIGMLKETKRKNFVNNKSYISYI